MRVAVIERKLFGGTCVNTGCTPTKTLVASAYAAHLARRAAEFGVRIGGDVAIDMKAVKARKDAVSGKSRDGVETWLRGMERCTVYPGPCALRIAATKSVSRDELLSADRIFLNVGGRAVVPDMPGHRPGARADQHHDPGAGHRAAASGDRRRQLYRAGIRADVSPLRQRGHGRRKGAAADPARGRGRLGRGAGDPGGRGHRRPPERRMHPLRAARRRTSRSASTAPPDAPEVVGSHVLLAVGRRPNTDDLGLDRAGVAMRRARLSSRSTTSCAPASPGIWALGDCNGRGAFTHTAYNDFEIVAANLLDGGQRAGSATGSPPTRCTSIRRSAASGMTEAEARQAGRPIRVGKRPMTRVGRAVEKGETQGFMKVVVDAETDAILGAAILGVGGDEAVHGMLDTMAAKAPYTTLRHAVHDPPDRVGTDPDGAGRVAAVTTKSPIVGGPRAGPAIPRPESSRCQVPPLRWERLPGR